MSAEAPSHTLGSPIEGINPHILLFQLNMADNVNATRAGGNASGARGSQSRNALDPRAPLLVQPFKRLIEEGYIKELTVSFTPLGTEVKGKASKTLVDVEGSGLNEVDYFPVGRLAAVAERGNLAPAPGKKKKNAGAVQAVQLPAKSLCKEDFAEGKSPQHLQQRANAVANAAGGGPLVGRVRSAGRFTATETISYQQWWQTASVADRALSLCQGRHLATLSDAEKGKLGGLQCPFRGTAEFAVAAEEEEEEEEHHE